jgi:delta24-sterol reductase
VELEYIPCTDIDNTCETFIKASRNNANDFVELLMYSKNTGIVMVGKLTDKAVPSKVNAIGKWYKPWFYKHVETFFAKGRSVEYIPLRDYYHRHTKSLFWEMQDIVPFGNNPVYRFLTGWLGAPHVQWFKMTTVGKLKELYDKHHVVQDMLVPINTIKESLGVFHKEFDLYPLWVCPMRLLTPPMEKKLIHNTTTSQQFPRDEKAASVTCGPNGLVNPLPTEQLYVDIGAYGNPQSVTYDYKKSLRSVEEYVRKVNGYQALYADTMMTREELRQMFDHRLYDKIRTQYGCVERLPEFYDKVCRSARD